MDQFNASPIAVSIGIGIPYAVHGIVVVTDGIFNGTTVGGHAGKGKIDGGILRSPLPEREEIRFSFIEALRIVAVAQGAGQAELILRIGRIAGERGTEDIDCLVVVAGVRIGQP